MQSVIFDPFLISSLLEPKAIGENPHVALKDNSPDAYYLYDLAFVQ